MHLAGTNGQNQPGQQGQHIYTEYQSLGPNNGLYGPFSGPKEGQRPTLREPLIYVPVAGPDGNRVPLVKVCDPEPEPEPDLTKCMLYLVLLHIFDLCHYLIHPVGERRASAGSGLWFP